MFSGPTPNTSNSFIYSEYEVWMILFGVHDIVAPVPVKLEYDNVTLGLLGLISVNEVFWAPPWTLYPPNTDDAGLELLTGYINIPIP